MSHKLIRKLVDCVLDNFTYLIFKKSINKYYGFDEVVIFDLDNTLIDTYPLLNHMPLREVFSNAVIHPNMMKILNDLSGKGVYVYILTSRKFQFYGVTKKYLSKNLNFKVPFYLVSEPIKKLKFVKYSSIVFNKVSYYDDLSYNHENGEVKFYLDVIGEIKKLPVSYFGYDEILKINQH
jgi:hypothetical protein